MSQRIHARPRHIGTTTEREAYTPAVAPYSWWDTDALVDYLWNGSAWMVGGTDSWDNVIVVATVQGDYSTLVAAVAAANDGDIILVMNDITEDVTVDTAVTIAGLGSEAVTITGALLIDDDVALRNLAVSNDDEAYVVKVASASNCTLLRIEHCQLTGSRTSAQSVLDVDDSGVTVEALDTDIEGTTADQAGVDVSAGAVTLRGCRLFNNGGTDLKQTGGTLNVAATVYDTSVGTITDILNYPNLVYPVLLDPTTGQTTIYSTVQLAIDAADGSNDVVILPPKYTGDSVAVASGTYRIVSLAGLCLDDSSPSINGLAFSGAATVGLTGIRLNYDVDLYSGATLRATNCRFGKIGTIGNVGTVSLHYCYVSGQIKCDTLTLDHTVCISSISANSTIYRNLATDAETQTGTSRVKAVTPASLQSKVSSISAKGIVELATNAETQTGSDSTRAVTPAGLRSDAPVVPASGRIARLDSDGILVMPSSIWRIGETVLDLGFTGTDYDTKAECQAVGLRFSDSDVPFPDTLRFPTSGTWAHSAGNGWAASSSILNEGPAILLPLCRPGNWELEIVLDFGPTAAQTGFLLLGYISNSNHVGAYGRAVDAGGTVQMQARLYTNNNDDTYFSQWAGAALVGTGMYTYKFRCKNGCVSFWDAQDSAWHDYEGRQNAGHAYTAAAAFVQITKYTGTLWTDTSIQSLKLAYLL